MRERPVIFSAPMVRAVLAGTKTQTRRVVREQEALTFLACEDCRDDGGDLVVSYMPDHPRGAGWYAYCGEYPEEGTEALGAPYGRPGDRLWVRETWGMSFLEHVPEGRPATPGGTWGVPAYPHWNPCVVYRADGVMPQAPDGIEVARWSPPIHMPRWASRLTLEVTDVRIERLQDITPDDARAEGHPRGPGTERYPQEVHDEAAREWFMDLWDDINAKRDHSWESNPWVWVVEFQRVDP